MPSRAQRYRSSWTSSPPGGKAKSYHGAAPAASSHVEPDEPPDVCALDAMSREDQIRVENGEAKGSSAFDCKLDPGLRCTRRREFARGAGCESTLRRVRAGETELALRAVDDDALRRARAIGV